MVELIFDIEQSALKEEEGTRFFLDFFFSENE